MTKVETFMDWAYDHLLNKILIVIGISSYSILLLTAYSFWG